MPRFASVLMGYFPPHPPEFEAGALFRSAVVEQAMEKAVEVNRI